jgi:hypothetical protein
VAECGYPEDLPRSVPRAGSPHVTRVGAGPLLKQIRAFGSEGGEADSVARFVAETT